MRFKKDTKEIENLIRWRAESVISSSLSGSLGYGSATQPITNALTQAVSQAIAEGFRVMIENQYTDDDFERDLTLKP